MDNNRVFGFVLTAIASYTITYFLYRQFKKQGKPALLIIVDTAKATVYERTKKLLNRRKGL